MANRDRDNDGYDRLDSWGQRQAGNFADRPMGTIFKWLAALAVIVLFGAFVFGVVNWISGWGGETARVTGPQNSREQTTAVLDDWNSLKATAGNVCDVTNSKSNADSPTLVEDPAFAFRAKYRAIKADYDRRMNNFFEAGVTRSLPIPRALRGYPREAPTLKEMQAEVC